MKYYFSSRVREYRYLLPQDLMQEKRVCKREGKAKRWRPRGLMGALNSSILAAAAADPSVTLATVAGG